MLAGRLAGGSDPKSVFEAILYPFHRERQNRDQTEGRIQKSEVKRQKLEDRSQKTEA